MRDINESIANAIEIGVSKYIEKYLEKDKCSNKRSFKQQSLCNIH